MIARCPNCLFKYEIAQNGKYQCGVCEQKFFLFRNGAVESAEDNDCENNAGGAFSMIAKCPNCRYEYKVMSNGKYQCGVCEQKFFLFRNGAIESADDMVSGGTKENDRRFRTGDVILGHYRVLSQVEAVSSRVVYRCFDDNSLQYVFLQDLFPDVAVADSKTVARFQLLSEAEVKSFVN